MKRDPLIYGIVGVLIGGVIIWFLATNAVNNNNAGMMKMMGLHSSSSQTPQQGEHMMGSGMMMGDNEMMEEGMTMNDMVEDLKGKSGDEFDSAFITGMIEHHQGAIDMAELAQQYAGHDEIKNLADAIIAAQTSEIEQMKQWFTNWGY